MCTPVFLISNAVSHLYHCQLSRFVVASGLLRTEILSNKQSGDLVQMIVMMLSWIPSEAQRPDGTQIDVFSTFCPMNIDLCTTEINVFVDPIEAGRAFTDFSGILPLGENRSSH